MAINLMILISKVEIVLFLLSLTKLSYNNLFYSFLKILPISFINVIYNIKISMEKLINIMFNILNLIPIFKIVSKMIHLIKRNKKISPKINCKNKNSQ
jgi:hypothetical protein